MSGISTVININNGIRVKDFQRMMDIINHRGPDGVGYYLCGINFDSYAYDNNLTKEEYDNSYFLGMGHRALITDDTFFDSRQPLWVDEYTIIFDGNIYNYIDIKNELEDKGYVFNTNSDTEIIIKAYKEWGEECVNRFNGEWAFIIWDKKNFKMFCSRDRLGIKPFYYYMTDEEFIVSSEIKQILEYGVKPKVNEKVLFTFLFYGIENFSNETFFGNILSLSGGENLSISIETDKKVFGIKRYRYWKLDYKKKFTGDFEPASEYIGIALNNSIKYRLNTTKKVGSLLSGGLDSSSIVALACKELNKMDINPVSYETFTACYDEDTEVDERYYSDLVVEASGCSNTKVKPTTNKIKSDFKRLVWHQEEPFGGFSIFAGWCVMEQVKQSGVRVLLDGQGGDETLLGYERYYAFMLKDLLKNFKFKDAINAYKLSAENSGLTKKTLFAYLIYFNSIKVRKRRLKFKNKKFLSSSFASKFLNIDIVDHLLKFKGLDEALENAITNSISHLLKFVDRNTSAHSIESRLPFLDIDFIEKAVNIPNDYKLRDGWTKACLRRYMEGKMPQEVVYRKNKLGFSVPQEKWLNELNDYFSDMLLDDCLSHRFFNMEYIRESFKNKTNSDARFKFIIIELWMRTFDIQE